MKDSFDLDEFFPDKTVKLGLKSLGKNKGQRSRDP